MGTPKADALALIQAMPDDCTWDDVAYRVCFRSEVEKGLADVAAGRVTPHDEVKRQVSEWLKSFGPKEPAGSSS